MAAARPTWIIVVRDLSHAVSIEDQPDTTACVVLDADTGLIRGVSVAGDPREACAGAVESALTKPAAELPPSRPTRVVCVDERTLRLARPHLARHSLRVEPVVASSPAAEDVVDSLVGHLTGRGVPVDIPTPDDWSVLFSAIHRFAEAEPWRRWSDTDYFDLILSTTDETTPDEGSDYVAVVMGQAGIQRGLSLYPGFDVPDLTGDWSPGEPVPLPAGTLLVWLDPPDELPPEYLAKATRYGWPTDAAVFPVPLAIGPDGPLDVDRSDAHDLTLAAAAMIAHLAEGGDVTDGDAALAHGLTGTFAVRRHRPPPAVAAMVGGPEPGLPVPEAGPLPALAPPAVADVARAARSAPLLERAAALAAWVGQDRPVTSTLVLKPADAKAAIAELRLPAPPTTPRSARDVPALHRLWEVARELTWLELGSAGRPRVTGRPPTPPADDDEALNRWFVALSVALNPESLALGRTAISWSEASPPILAGLYVAYSERKGLPLDGLPQFVVETLTGMAVPMLPEGFIADAAAHVDGLFEALTDLSAVEVRGATATLTPLGAFGLHDWLEDEGYEVPIKQPGGAAR